jgi:tetratricopeptide (TPR) repeat protein
VEARIALRAKNLSSSWDYVRLVEFCREQGRAEEALRRAEEGLWMFEDDRPDERLLFLAVDLLTKAGRKDDAEAKLWRAFEKSPSFELYARLRKLGGKAGRERAVVLLQRRLGKEKRSQWHYPADLLVRILTHEKVYDAAWAAVHQHQASMGVSEALARASESSHPREALETYAARVEGLVNGGTAYAEAVKLIAHMAALRSADEHASYVAALRARHGRKRNLMKLLG